MTATPLSPFPPALYAPWCRLWLLIQDRQQALVETLGQQTFVPERGLLEVPTHALAAELDRVLAALDGGSAEINTLVQALRCLRSLERDHPADPRQFRRRCLAGTAGEDCATVVETLAGKRHALVPPPRYAARPSATEASFRLSGEVGLERALGLAYRWLPLRAEDDLNWGYVAELDLLRHVSPLRIGLAPFASADEMAWKLDPADARQPDGHVPLECLGGHDRASLWASFEAILAAAWEQRSHVLLLPELVVDADLLQRCRDWLRTHNLRDPRLQLVVAGSRHCRSGGDFVNRCTVLGQLGDVLWQQDKRTLFYLDEAAAIARLCPENPPPLAAEPTRLGRQLVLAETIVGRLLTPICIDYIEGDLWRELGADFYLVPAMTPSLGRFADTAMLMGGRHGAASCVCNARTEGSVDHRRHCYVPSRKTPVLTQVAGRHLFTVDIPINV